MGCLWWILGPLTLTPLLMGSGPTWDVATAAASFFDLIGHLLFGAVTGISFHLLVTFSLRWWVMPESAVPLPIKPAQIVIVGGGFGGVAAAQQLEKIIARDPAIESTLISQSNFLLFTPMLAEVASSALEAQHISAPVRAALPQHPLCAGGRGYG
ncbi:NADH dehydrogenase [hydrothermal vent metagenome]|uniref:NADH dehydrogenase n=1 Tax=hydrothermal vent metagenome TaxID=652676 RepID=A0A3B0VQN9_9ZZZZ